MLYQFRSPVAVFALLLPSAPLLAHHGTAGTYDPQKVVEYTGTVKEFVYRNPHAALILTGKDASGKEVTYSFEVLPPGGLVRNGIHKDTFKAGDTVSLSAHPAYGNPNVGKPVGGKFVLNGKPMTGLGTDQDL